MISTIDSTRTQTRSAEFWQGVKATFPLVVGAIPFGIIFGAVAVNSGLSVAATAAMSAFVFAGSSQFVAAGLVAGGAGAFIIILTTFVVNLRHSLYSATLAPHMKHLPQRWLVPLGFWLTDESFLVVEQRYRQPDASPYKHWFFLGSAIFMYTNWQLCTWIGICRRPGAARPGQLGARFCAGRDLHRHAGAGAAQPAGDRVRAGRGRGGIAAGRPAQPAGPDRGDAGWRGRRDACRTRAVCAMMTAQEALLVAGMAPSPFSCAGPCWRWSSRVSLPRPVLDGMKFIPPAVLTAIIVPAMFMPTGSLELSITNAYLVAGIASGVIAFRTRNLLLTIVLGMALFLLWRWFW